MKPITAAALFLLLLLVAGALPAGAQTTPAVSLTRLVVVATGADPDTGTLQVMEKLLLRNDSGAPYQPDRPETSALKIAVPAGARDVTLESGPSDTTEATLARAGQAYTLTSPLPPGQQTLVVSYALPYTARPGAATLRISHPLAMPAGAVQVMVPAVAEVQVRATRGLAAAEPLTMGSQRYNVLEATSLDSGAGFDFVLSGLPTGAAAPDRGATSVAFATLPDGALLAATGAVLAAGLLYGLWRTPALSVAPAAPAAPQRGRRR